MAASVHVGDIGTVLEVTARDQDNAVISLAGATVLTMILVKPDGGRVSKTAVLTSDGTDGKLRYTTVAGDLDQRGVWRLAAVVTIGASTKFTTDAHELYVAEGL